MINVTGFFCFMIEVSDKLKSLIKERKHGYHVVRRE